MPSTLPPSDSNSLKVLGSQKSRKKEPTPAGSAGLALQGMYLAMRRANSVFEALPRAIRSA
jgi:hypothetical protein